MNKYVRAALLPLGYAALGVTVVFISLATVCSGLAVAIIEDSRKS